MPRIPAIDPDQADGKAKELLDQAKEKMGKAPNILRTMANAPAVLQGYLQFSGALKTGGLSDQERELLALRISQTNECDYCLSAHSAIGANAGLSDAQMEAARQGDGSDERSKALIAFVDRVLATRGFVGDDDIQQARDRGLGDADLLEVVGAVALNTLTNYTNHLAETEVDFPQAKPVGG